MGSVRLPPSTTTTRTPTLASVSAAGKPGCSNAPCNFTAATTQPGSVTASRSPRTVPASGPKHTHTHTHKHTHTHTHTHTDTHTLTDMCR
ncbi:hypothetical protein LDENG_00278820 [Lucifuga dentata]|nr:hypothetical protein LDENG_00278820 [Lucifuga dentata]